MMGNYFNLYPNCIITKGESNSLIVDYKREIYFQIPCFIHAIIEELCQSNLEDILFRHKIDSEIGRKVLDLKDWLVRNNLGLMSTRSHLFAPLSNNFKFTSISNAVIEIEDVCNYDVSTLENILKELVTLRCKTIQLIFTETHELTAVSQFLTIFNKIIFQSIEIIVRFKTEPSIEEMEALINQKLFLKKIYIMGCRNQKTIQLKKLNAVIVFSTEMRNSSKDCGTICKEYFSLNLMTYFESQKHNTCLNQKIAIDRKGNIKNCLSFKESYGNIHESSLITIINSKSFKKYWNISKDYIHTCKSCEFRHVCTDCRALIEDPNDIYSKPLKCGYDPIKGLWEPWQSNPIKQKVIEYYEL